MKGAEIALVTGTRIKVGRGEACDIVIADASLAETAFELDVADTAVTLITPDGTTREVKPFEIYTFGTTSFAAGFVDAPWEELRLAQVETSSEPPPPLSSPIPPPEDSAAPAEPATTAEEHKKRSGCGFVCWVAFVLVLLVLVLAWFFRGVIAERVPRLKPWIERLESRAAATPAGSCAEKLQMAEVSLRSLAVQHGLSYAERDGHPLLTGNLLRRSERLAIRALALAKDRKCDFDLSDDETLASSAEALLFTVTEGALKVSVATNRTVALSGYAPSAAALGAALKALRADVPWVHEIDVAAVEVGGPVPTAQKGSAFAVSGELSAPAAAPSATPVAAPVEKPEPVESAEIQIADEHGRKLPRNMFPVAGILTRPYPCVVLRDGHRIVEGGQLGAYTVVRIGADQLELKQGEGLADWEP